MLQANGIIKTYPGAADNRPALQGVDFNVEQGEFVAVVGRSGSGKSTLLHVLSTLLSPDQGSLSYRGEELTALDEGRLNALRRQDFAVVFQFHYLLPYLTALENTVLPFMQGLRSVPRPLLERAQAGLERVGLAGKEERLPSELSGGEQQRVAIARALVKDAAILFADEPTGSLDKATGTEILDLLQGLNREGLSIVMVTHEPAYAARAGRLVRMEDGRLAA